MYILIVATIIILLLLFIWICNKKYKNSNYFLEDYNKIKKFVDGVPENLEIVNTGSNHAYYGFNYDDKKYFNFASGAQSLNYDYKILKQYSNNLNDSCKVLIVLAPLSFGFVDYKDNSSNSRYYFFIDKDKILNYSRLKNFLYVDMPILKSWKNFIRIFLRKKEIKPVINTPDNAEKEALLRINGWKKQFNLKDLLDMKSAYCLKDEFEKVIVQVKVPRGDDEKYYGWIGGDSTAEKIVLLREYIDNPKRLEEIAKDLQITNDEWENIRKNEYWDIDISNEKDLRKKYKSEE